MSQSYNIYCDESCHLEHDASKVMVLGAIWCPQEKVREAAVRLREIKASHGLSETFELKWTKVGPAKLAFYREVVDYFFDNDDLHFRALVVPDKSKLDHAAHPAEETSRRKREGGNLLAFHPGGPLGSG